MNNIKPYFVEDIEAQLQSAYFATAKQSGIDGARVVFVLCLAFSIKPVWMKPEHLQALQREMR